MRRNILMICYYYPPLTDVGCKRSVAFSKYFKKHGWNPFVLTVKNPDKTYCSLGNDKPPPGISVEYSYSVVNLYKFFGKINGLLSRLLKLFGSEIKRNYFYDIFCIPDIFVGWIPLTTLKGYKLIKQRDIDIIYVSCTPYSSAIIGILLKFITKKPLVIDFRDAYALEIRSLRSLFSPFQFRKRLDRWIAHNLLKYVDLFIVVTEEMRKLYIHQYPQVKNKIFAVHNGFDSEFILNEKPSSKYAKFTIVYMGDFYLYAEDSEIFFEALTLLKKRKRINKSTFQFLFYGDGGKKLAEIARDYGIEDLVSVNSRIPYEDILNVISRSHLQLLRVLELAMPTKLYDGLSLNIPFLATIPAGEAQETIRKYSPSSYIIAEQSSGKIADAILDAMAKYKEDQTQDNYVDKFLENFSREKLSLKLMKIIEEDLNSVRSAKKAKQEGR